MENPVKIFPEANPLNQTVLDCQPPTSKYLRYGILPQNMDGFSPNKYIHTWIYIYIYIYIYVYVLYIYIYVCIIYIYVLYICIINIYIYKCPMLAMKQCDLKAIHVAVCHEWSHYRHCSSENSLKSLFRKVTHSSPMIQHMATFTVCISCRRTNMSYRFI